MRVAPARVAAGLGVLLALAGVAFVARTGIAVSGELSQWQPTPRFVAVVLGATVAYGGLGFALAEAWRRELEAFSGCALERSVAYRVYAHSQLAKYLPGNVFHLVGRHSWGRSLGFRHAPLAAAAVAEAAGLVAAAGFLGFLGVGAERASIGSIGPLVIGSWVVAVAIPLTLAFAVRRGALERLGLPRQPPGSLRQAMGLAFVLRTAFFAGSGVLLLSLLTANAEVVGERPAVLAAFCLAWLVGFLTPGAPAGLGVREALLVAVLGPTWGTASVLIAAVALRVVTVGGDALFAVLAMLLPAAAVEPGE